MSEFRFWHSECLARLMPPTLALLWTSQRHCIKSTSQKSQYYHSLGGKLHWNTLIPQLAYRNDASAFVGHHIHMMKIICSDFELSSPISAPMAQTFLPAAEFHIEFSEQFAVGLNTAGSFSRRIMPERWRATKLKPLNYCVPEHEDLL